MFRAIFYSLLFMLLLGYSVFSDRVAYFILSGLVQQTDHAYTSTTHHDLIELPSSLENELAIPSILIENTSYQQASVIDGLLSIRQPATPLGALVNIYCTHKTGRQIRTTTGSGFFIHPRGVILTNAHVSQLLLLAQVDGDTECIARKGTPATSAYNIDLLYISPAWIRQHAHLLRSTSPSGTGERDYALLYVTGSLTDTPLPNQFPTLPIKTSPLPLSYKNTPIRAAGYPATALATEGRFADLRGVEVGSIITELMTFGSNMVDLVTLAGTELGTQGVSGGPVVNQEGRAIGLITTRGNDELFGNGSLRALTISYIDRTISEETGFSLTQNLGGDLNRRAKIFQETIGVFLTSILRNELER